VIGGTGLPAKPPRPNAPAHPNPGLRGLGPVGRHPWRRETRLPNINAQAAILQVSAKSCPISHGRSDPGCKWIQRQFFSINFPFSQMIDFGSTPGISLLVFIKTLSPWRFTSTTSLQNPNGSERRIFPAGKI
jgi:hypothetical protein